MLTTLWPAYFECCVLCFHINPVYKLPSVSPAFGEKKKRKGITLKMRLKTLAQHEGSET